MLDVAIERAVERVMAGPLDAGSGYRIVYLWVRGLVRFALELGESPDRIRLALAIAWDSIAEDPAIDELDAEVRDQAVVDELAGIPIVD